MLSHRIGVPSQNTEGRPWKGGSEVKRTTTPMEPRGGAERQGPPLTLNCVLVHMTHCVSTEPLQNRISVEPSMHTLQGTHSKAPKAERTMPPSASRRYVKPGSHARCLMHTVPLE